MLGALWRGIIYKRNCNLDVHLSFLINSRIQINEENVDNISRLLDFNSTSRGLFSGAFYRKICDGHHLGVRHADPTLPCSPLLSCSRQVGTTASTSAHVTSSQLLGSSQSTAFAASVPNDDNAILCIRIQECNTMQQLSELILSQKELDVQSLSLALNQATLCHKLASSEARSLRERRKQTAHLDQHLHLSDPNYLNPGSSPPVESNTDDAEHSKQNQQSSMPSLTAETSSSLTAETSPPLFSEQPLLSFLGQQYMKLLKSGDAGQPGVMDPLLSVKLLLAFVDLKHHPGVGAAGLMDICQHMNLHVLPVLRLSPPENLLGLLWAVGKLSSQERVLLEEKVMQARAVNTDLFNQSANFLFARVHSFQLGQLSRLTQSFALAGVYYYPLLNTIATAARSKLGELDNINIGSFTSILKSFARLGYSNELFFNEVSARLVICMRDVKGHQVAAMLKSFASLKYINQSFYEVASLRVQVAVMDMNPAQISDVAWSYAVREQQDVKLFNALAYRAKEVMHEAKPQHLAKIVWSFARQGLLQSAMLKESVVQASRTLKDYSFKNMSNLVWGYARMDFYDEHLFAAVAKRLCLMLQDPEGRIVDRTTQPGSEIFLDSDGRQIRRYMCPDTKQWTEDVLLHDGTVLSRPSQHTCLFIPQNLSDVVWAFSDRGHKDDRLLGLIAERSTSEIQNFGKTSVVDLAFGFASAKYYDQALFKAIEEAAMPLLPDFGPAYMSELLWSLATLGHKPSTDFISASLEVSWNKWERVSSDRDWLTKTIWALLKLEADKVVPHHPLLGAFSDALKESDMRHNAGSGAAGGAGNSGIEGAGGGKNSAAAGHGGSSSVTASD
ncbi:hypothetical protein CEUSTIGMA_g8466.t1 [Chlamydomonas eustigma]|uniref:RNA-editing substrate-binding complex 6 protein domain-containing protein n=1 Tax=Chlamydomonas eustigma TaxID=1157962 RepID=A0A250XD80_9CHLO|nr:hypothetical protein CEUSTIGMA_g8466.t1 [Chlamydomonas eustigma]|eukprot:GAX81031.1 hypothetical protein CEUSTIGMA_g8466.t1 [Chlamydomonas eustigma]